MIAAATHARKMIINLLLLIQGSAVAVFFFLGFDFIGIVTLLGPRPLVLALIYPSQQFLLPTFC
jgi:hypothetical protein